MLIKAYICTFLLLSDMIHLNSLHNNLINFTIARWWQKKLLVELMKCFYSLEQRSLTRRLVTGFINMGKAFYLRNRKHVPCFYRVLETQVNVWENKKCCGNMSRRQVFHSFFKFSQTFTSVSVYNLIKTQRTCFLFLLENTATQKRK